MEGGKAQATTLTTGSITEHQRTTATGRLPLRLNSVAPLIWFQFLAGFITVDDRSKCSARKWYQRNPSLQHHHQSLSGILNLWIVIERSNFVLLFLDYDVLHSLRFALRAVGQSGMVFGIERWSSLVPQNPPLLSIPHLRDSGRSTTYNVWTLLGYSWLLWMGIDRKSSGTIAQSWPLHPPSSTTPAALLLLLPTLATFSRYNSRYPQLTNSFSSSQSYQVFEFNSTISSVEVRYNDIICLPITFLKYFSTSCEFAGRLIASRWNLFFNVYEPTAVNLWRTDSPSNSGFPSNRAEPLILNEGPSICGTITPGMNSFISC